MDCGNGHWYDIVSTGRTFTSAKSAAEGGTFDGRKGQLATINSQAEYDFLRQSVVSTLLTTTSSFSLWLGADYNTNTSSYQWYERQAGTAPDARTNLTFTTPGFAPSSTANTAIVWRRVGDASLSVRQSAANNIFQSAGTSVTLFRLIEYGAFVPVPVPASMPLVATGLGALAFAARRRVKAKA